MVIRKVELERVLGVSSEIPDTGKMELVLAGRSNVGKSSFINAFIHRKSYARTSQTPGKTRTINFYHVNDAFYLVDLPGYGYASTGAAEQEKWDRMIRRYFDRGRNIEEVVLLVDIRHDPTRLDIQMFRYLLESTGYEPLVVLTKADKLKRSQIQKARENIRKGLNASPECTLIPFSAETKLGLPEIYEIIDRMLDTEALE